MEKISGIIPSSPRVSTVDLKNAGTVRPGAPGFGRAQGISSLAQTSAIDVVDRMSLHELSGHRKTQKSPEHDQAKIVSDITSGFFMKRKREADESPILRDMNVSKIDFADPKNNFSIAGPEDSMSLLTEVPLEDVAGSRPIDQSLSIEAASSKELISDLKPQDFTEQMSELQLDYDMDRPEVGGYLDVHV